MGTSISAAILSQAACTNTITETVAPWGTWVTIPFAAVTSAASIFNIVMHFKGQKTSKKVAVDELLVALDLCENRAVTCDDVTVIRGFGRRFERLAKLRPKTKEIATVANDIAAVCEVREPDDDEGRNHYQQQLGAAMDRLKDSADKAYNALNN